MRTIPIGLFGLVALIAASPSRAQPPILVDADAPTATVNYADLNLGNPEGVRMLEARAQLAATDICLSAFQHTSLDRWTAERRCYDTAIADARQQIDRAVAGYGTQVAALATIVIAAR